MAVRESLCSKRCQCCRKVAGWDLDAIAPCSNVGTHTRIPPCFCMVDEASRWASRDALGHKSRPESRWNPCRFKAVGTGSSLGKCKNITQKINWLHCLGSSSKLILKSPVSAGLFALLK